MKITYDQDVDALYIQFKKTTVTTMQVAEGIAIDYDAEGRLAGIEILDAVRSVRARAGEELRVGIDSTVEVDGASNLESDVRLMLEDLDLADRVRVESS